MIIAVAFVVAAALGAAARSRLMAAVNRPGAFPGGTFLVNISGSFLLGLLAGSTPPVVTVVGVSALGTYTTFSAFAVETLDLVTRRRQMVAGAYAVASVVGAVVAAAAGVGLSGS